MLDNGSSPVELCIQKLVLGALHEAAFVEDRGVLASWDSTTFVPDKDDGGAPLHDVHDDVAFGAAINAYGLSATRYGDTELTPTLDQDLIHLVPTLKKELATLPDEYSGELYMHLRGVAVGLRYLNQNDDANAMDQIADAMGRAIFGHFVPLAANDGVLAQNAIDRDYAPADVATGALALLDMAVRHTADDAANAVKWADAAQASLDHIYARGREPIRKMYFRLLVPSAAAEKDDLSPRAPAPQDVLTTDASGTVALALLRAGELTANNKGALPKLVSYPFVARANEAIASVNAAPSLYDAARTGYMEGYVPSTATLLTNKPTRANALLFAAIHRANVADVSPYASQLKPLRTVMAARSPSNVSLLTSGGAQNAYFQAVSKDFGLLSSDGGAGAGSVPRPNSYASAAILIAVEGFNEQWVGVP